MLFNIDIKYSNLKLDTALSTIMTITRSGVKAEEVSGSSKRDHAEEAGSKHNLDSKGSPESKRTKRNDGDKEQQTIEDSLPRY